MLSLYAKIFLVCLFFGTSATQRNEPEKVVTPHQVTQYDKAGPYSIGNTLTFAERNQLLSRVRSFLWDHWSQRRPGQLQVTVYTVEGDPTTYVFFYRERFKGPLVHTLKVRKCDCETLEAQRSTETRNAGSHILRNRAT